MTFERNWGTLSSFSWMFWYMMSRFCFSSLSRRSMKFAAVRRMSRSCVDMFWQDPNEIPNLLANSWIVTQLYSWASSLIRATFSSVLRIETRPEPSATLIDITSLLNFENQINIWILFTVSSLKASFNISKVSVAVFPTVRQNLMYTRCIFVVCHFFRRENRKGHNT